MRTLFSSSRLLGSSSRAAASLRAWGLESFSTRGSVFLRPSFSQKVAGWLSWDSGLRVMAQVAIWGIRSFTRRRAPYSKEVSTAFSSSPASRTASMIRSTISSSRSK